MRFRPCQPVLLEAAEKNLLDQKRGEQLKQLEGRNEVIP
jgi:hypothetical protein